MDPNANLKEQRKIASIILEWFDTATEEADFPETEAQRLAELVQSLDEWISKGGFLPDAWVKQ